MGLGEADAVRGVPELLAEVVEPREEVLEALHLDHRAREAVDDGPGVVLGLEELAEEDLDHLAVADEHAGVDALLGLGAGEEVADHDGLGAVIAVLEDELGVGALTGARGAVQPEDFPGERELGPAELPLEAGPDGIEDDLAILDLKVADAVAGRSGGSFAHAWGKRSDSTPRPPRARRKTPYFPPEPVLSTLSEPGRTRSRPGSSERFRRNW